MPINIALYIIPDFFKLSLQQISATDKEINTLVYKLYDLTDKDEFFEVPLFVFCFGFILSLCDAVALGAP